MSRTSIIIPRQVADQVSAPSVQEAVAKAVLWSHRDEVPLPLSGLTDAVLAELLEASEGVDKSFHREIAAMQAGRDGNFKPIPRFRAALSVMADFIQKDAEDLQGWVYSRKGGSLRAYLITGLHIREGRGPTDKDNLVLTGAFNSVLEGRRNRREEYGSDTLTKEAWYWEPGEVTRKTPDAILAARGLMTETPELYEEYLAQEERYRQILTEGFARQYRFSGKPNSKVNSWDTPNYVGATKVVHDIHPDEIPPFVDVTSDGLAIAGEGEEEGRDWQVPIHFDLRVFDLRSHEYWIVDSADMTEYVYDHSLREKLVLPEDQRDLLDILTADISTFTADLIEGKSAGNVILCKGIPGVGKTLSAEVYAELTERPLYSIHSGSLGTTAEGIRKNLESIFKRSQRWDAVLLLDEADVFVIERGNNLEQNAIVAEFLRTMEYFDGLMFMTTNRSESIDEAVVSRCAAIIDYRVPGAADARRIWRVLAALSDTTLDDDLVTDLLRGFPKIAPRDIKMLLRLTLRVAKAKGEPLSVDLFRRCAMFRGLHFVSKEEDFDV